MVYVKRKSGFLINFFRNSLFLNFTYNLLTSQLNVIDYNNKKSSYQENNREQIGQFKYHQVYNENKKKT